jgi:outer membrane protein assembly factor BamB
MVNGDERLILATQGGRVHVLRFNGEEVSLEEPIDLDAPVNTPLLGADGSIFVTATSGVIRQFSGDNGVALFSASLSSDIVVAPNIGLDGVIYAGSIAGLFSAVCTNGAQRFQAGLGAISALSAATPDPSDEERTIILAASDNGRVQGFGDLRGDILWTFFTAGRLMGSAVVVDESRGRFIVPDSDGRIYAASFLTGRPLREDGTELVPYRVARCIPSGTPCATEADCGAAESCAGEAIRAAGALGSDHFYVTTQGARSETGALVSPGSLYAFSLDFQGGGAAWTFPLPEQGRSQSSPLVATGGDREIVVFGADLECDEVACATGAVMAVADGELLWTVPLPDPVGAASASVRRTAPGGVIYIGTTGGKLYEIQ